MRKSLIKGKQSWSVVRTATQNREGLDKSVTALRCLLAKKSGAQKVGGRKNLMITILQEL